MIGAIATCAVLSAWIYVASCYDADGFYNLYVNRIRAALFRPVTALQRSIPKLSEKAAAWLFFSLVVLASAALARFAWATSTNPRAAGASFGGGVVVLSLSKGFPAPFFLAAGRFAVLLGQLSLLRVVLDLRLGGTDKSGARTMLDTATWPLSLPGSVPAAAGAACAALFVGSWLCMLSSSPAAVAAAFPALRLALVSAADLMLVVRDVMLVGCVLSWIRPVPDANPRRSFWRETFDFVSGLSSEAMSDVVRAVVGSNPMSLGFVSFAPLVAFFVLGWLHRLAVALLV